jgi:hypothetical protein
MANDFELSIEIDDGIISLQKKLRLPDNFFKDLLAENDWSFIIKLHALIEGICGDLLVFHFNEPRLGKIFSRLNMSDTSTGKLAFLRETELISSLNSKYITSLSQLRNELVHNVQNYNLNLKDMVAKLEANQKKSFAIAFSPFETQIREFKKFGILKSAVNNDLEKQVNLDNIIKSFEINPKVHIWSGACSLFISIAEMYGYSDYQQYVKAKKVHNEDREIP